MQAQAQAQAQDEEQAHGSDGSVTREDVPAGVVGDKGEKSPETSGDHTSSTVEPTTEHVEWPITIRMPPEGEIIELKVLPSDTLMEVKHLLSEMPASCHMTSFSFVHSGDTITSDLLELRSLKGFGPNSVLDVVEAPYTEFTARQHVIHLREVMAHPPPQAIAGEDGIKQHREVVDWEWKRMQEMQHKTEPSKPEDKNSTHPICRLSLYPLPAPRSKPAKCVEYIVFSGWNPVPGRLRLQGHLFYLEVKTTEGRILCITAWTNGFYVNATQGGVFNPARAHASCDSHTLAGLLMQASPSFKARFSSLFALPHAEFHPYAYFPAPEFVNPWITSDTAHEFDLNRAEESVASLLGADAAGLTLRDWNEEHQGQRELATHTLEKKVHDRLRVQLHRDFVNSSLKIVRAIVHGNIQPLFSENTDNPFLGVYVHNNVFFHHAVNIPDVGTGESPYENDEHAYAAAHLDLLGAATLERADVPGLHTVMMVVMNYCGRRLVAQSIFPGLFHGSAGKIIYGYEQEAEVVAPDTPPRPPSKAVVDHDVHEKLKAAAGLLPLKESRVRDRTGQELHVVGSLEQMKAVRGTDGRTYVLDIGSLTPRDPNFLENPAAYLRLELLVQYSGLRKFAQIKEKLGKDTSTDQIMIELLRQEEEGLRSRANGKNHEETAKEGETPEKAPEETAKEGETPEKIPEETAKEGETPEKIPEETAKEGETPEKTPEETAKEDMQTHETEKLVRCNLNVFTKTELADTQEENAKDEALVKELGDLLVNVAIPLVVQNLQGIEETPGEGTVLKEIMHEKGVNLRYLGHITEEVRKTTRLCHIEALCVREMIARSARHIFNKIMGETPLALIAKAVAHFLNCFLGASAPPSTNGEQAHEAQAGPSSSSKDENQTCPNPAAEVTTEKRRRRKKRGGATGKTPQEVELERTASQLTHSSLWDDIRRHIKEHYRYVLTEEDALSLHYTALLRNFCLKTGIQLQARDYDLGSAFPFCFSDVLDLYPVVKCAAPEVTEAKQALSLGEFLLQQNHYDQAFQFFAIAQDHFQYACGPVDENVALCASKLATIFYTNNDFENASHYQHMAVAIWEKLRGRDSMLTIRGYMTLAVYAMGGKEMKSLEDFTEALLFLNRATLLCDLFLPRTDPGVAVVNLNWAALMLGLGIHVQSAIARTLSAKEVLARMEGEQTPRMAEIYNRLTEGFIRLGATRDALAAQRARHHILRDLLGEKSAVVEESYQIVSKLARSAVDAERTQYEELLKHFSKRGGTGVFASCST